MRVWMVVCGWWGEVYNGGVWEVGRVCTVDVWVVGGCDGVEVYMVGWWWGVVITVQQVCSYPCLHTYTHTPHTPHTGTPKHRRDS